MDKNEKIYTFIPLSPRQVYENQLKLKKADKDEQEFIRNNGDVVRSSKNKMSYKCETTKGKVLTIRNRFKDFRKKNMGKAKSREKKVKVRKEECVEKLRKYLNFYAKQNDLTYAYYSNTPMILLLYKEAYFNTNNLTSYVSSVVKVLFQELKDIFPEEIPSSLP